MTGEGFRDVPIILCEQTPDPNGGLGCTIREASPPTPLREFFSPPRGLSCRACFNPVCFDSSNRCDGRTSLCFLSCVKPNEEAISSVLGSWDLVASFTLQGSSETVPGLLSISRTLFALTVSTNAFGRLALSPERKTPGGGHIHPNSL